MSLFAHSSFALVYAMLKAEDQGGAKHGKVHCG